MVVLNGVLLRMGGSAAVAAFSIVLYVDSVANSLLFGMSDSLQGRRQLLLWAGAAPADFCAGKAGVLVGALVAALAFLLMRFGGEALLSLFLGHNSEVVGALALRAMELFSLTYLTCWFNVAISAFFTAVNRPGRPFILSFGNALVFPSLLALAVLPRLWGIDGVWLTPACGDLLTAVAAAALLLYFWRRKERKTALEEV